MRIEGACSHNVDRQKAAPQEEAAFFRIVDLL